MCLFHGHKIKYKVLGKWSLNIYIDQFVFSRVCRVTAWLVLVCIRLIFSGSLIEGLHHHVFSGHVNIVADWSHDRPSRSSGPFQNNHEDPSRNEANHETSNCPSQDQKQRAVSVDASVLRAHCRPREIFTAFNLTWRVAHFGGFFRDFAFIVKRKLYSARKGRVTLDGRNGLIFVALCIAQLTLDAVVVSLVEPLDTSGSVLGPFWALGVSSVEWNEEWRDFLPENEKKQKEKSDWERHLRAKIIYSYMCSFGEVLEATVWGILGSMLFSWPRSDLGLTAFLGWVLLASALESLKCELCFRFLKNYR